MRKEFLNLNVWDGLAEQKLGQGNVLLIVGEGDASDGFWYSPEAVKTILQEELQQASWNNQNR
jgi:hypothetical protein